MEPDTAVAMVIGDAASARAWSVYRMQDGQRDIIPYLTIDMPDDRASRLPTSYGVLAGKTVGLVGFRRRAAQHGNELERFFEKTGRDFGRYYLGEWHSHPHFSTTPSADDVRAMQELVHEPEMGFAVLIIVRLDWHFLLRVAGYVFSNDGSIALVKIG